MCGQTRPRPARSTRFADEVVHRLACHRLAALGHKQPRQLVFAHVQIALDGAKLVALDRLLG